MLNWIAGYVDRWAGRVGQEVRDLVHWGLHALAGVVYGVFGNVGKAWAWLVTALHWMHKAADKFSGEVTGKFEQLLHVWLPDLWNYAVAGFKRAEALALRYYRLALTGLQQLRQVARQWVDDALRWVTVHVWNPLVADVRQLRADLVKWGYYAYQLVTHPSRLAAILLDALIAAAESAFWRIAGPAGRFALRLVVANTRQLLALAEAIITAVL